MKLISIKNILVLTIISFSIPNSNVSAITNTQSMNFNSSASQRAHAPDSASLSITGNMTLESWFKSNNINTDQSIITKWHNPTGESYGFRYLGTTNKLNFYASNGTLQFFGGEISYPLKANVWYHLTVVYKASTGSAEFFVDGVSIGTKTGYPTSILDGAAKLEIGATQNGGGEFMNGLIDEARIWNTARTQTEIQNNMYKSLTGSESNLAGYWNLNSTSTDLTINGNNLTVVGATYSNEPAHHISCVIPQTKFLLTSAQGFALPSLTCTLLGLF